MTPAVLTTHRKLNEQAQRVLRFMIERGGISRRDGLELGILNVPARVLDIRTAYGPESVRTDMVERDGASFAVYRFVGLTDPQGDLGL
jgi:hypothetical protein